jgi:CheY-like chemotaxis protein
MTTGHENTRVLLVQGPEPDRDLLWAFFNGIKCRLDMVADVEEAKKAFAAGHHDLVITDVKPPRGSGLDVVRELHELSDKLTPFLFVSGTLTEEEVMRDLEPDLWVVGLLRKPIFIVDLVYTLRSLLKLPDTEEFLDLMGRLEPGDAGVSVLDEVLRDAGDLSRVPLGRVLYAVFETKRTGKLTVATSTGKVHFFFFRGEVVYLVSEREEDSLIQSMSRRGMLEVLKLPPGDRPDNLEDEIGLLMATRTLLPHKIPEAVQALLTEVVSSISKQRTGIYRLQPEDPPHRFMEAHNPIRMLLTAHSEMARVQGEFLGHNRDAQIVVRIPLSIDLARWKLPSVELRLAQRLRSMVGRGVSVEDFLRVYGEKDEDTVERVRAFLSLLTDMGYLDFRPPMHSDDDDRAIKDLLVEAHRIRKLNHFQLLRVRFSDGEDKFKQVYLDAARRYHPDRFFNRPARASALADVIQARYQEAYSVLSKDKKRKIYIAGLSDGELQQAGVTSQDMHDPARATILWREGERFLKVGKWEEAADYVTEALRYDGNRAEYHAAMGWVRFNLDKTRNRREALDMIRQAIAIDNNCDLAHYYQGMVAKADGSLDKAELFFTRALTANPDNFDAKREMRLLQRRSGSDEGETPGGSGFFESLFTKDLFGRKKK